jgi:hypothetical protein
MITDFQNISYGWVVDIYLKEEKSIHNMYRWCCETLEENEWIYLGNFGTDVPCYKFAFSDKEDSIWFALTWK